MTPQNRKTLWMTMEGPKPDWETFKRMIGQGMSVEKISRIWKKKAKQ